jgi:hypothetical protein
MSKLTRKPESPLRPRGVTRRAPHRTVLSVLIALRDLPFPRPKIFVVVSARSQPIPVEAANAGR